jgi:hypothetical protein
MPRAWQSVKRESKNACFAKQYFTLAASRAFPASEVKLYRLTHSGKAAGGNASISAWSAYCTEFDAAMP